MATRCTRCGKEHVTEDNNLLEAADPVCANCEGPHKPTSKACPKRAEFMAIRKRASTVNQPGRRKVPDINNRYNFPPPPGHPITLLQPLPLNNRPPTGRLSFAEVTAFTSTTPSPGLQGNTFTGSGLQFTQPPGGANDDSPLTTEEFVNLVRRSCRTRAEQLQAAVAIISKYGQ